MFFISQRLSNKRFVASGSGFIEREERRGGGGEGGAGGRERGQEDVK